MKTLVYLFYKHVMILFVNLLIFKHALTTSAFPFEWKKDNIVPCYRKGDKTFKITANFLYFLIVEEFLKDSYLMKSSGFFSGKLSPSA